MNKHLSIVILTHNNEDVLNRALESVIGIGKVLVVDSGSTDKTLNICNEFKVDLVINKFTSFKDQRNFALSIVDTEYTLFLDSDEKISQSLRNFLINDFKAVEQNVDINIFEIFRTEFYDNIEVVYGFGRSNYQTRLIRTKQVYYDGDVHEFPVCKDGKITKKLDSSLRIDHNPNRDLNSILNRLVPYARLASNKKIKNGRKVSLLIMILNFNYQLLRLCWNGRKDGRAGIIAAWCEALSRAITYLYIYDHNNKN